MHEATKLKEYQFCGALSESCASFIAEKRAVGYIYNTEAKHLSEFSRFSEKFNFTKNTLPKEVVEAWIMRRPNDSDRNYYSRYALVKLLAEYMHRTGYDAYCPDRGDIAKIHWGYTPHIFTRGEIARFFMAADSMEKKANTVSPRKHLIMPVLFRLLYCCGLRVSEAVVLKLDDVDLHNGVLTIRQSKFGKTRYIPMSTEITGVCCEYKKNVLCEKDQFFFPSPRGGGYDVRSVYSVFRDLLWESKISHGGRGSGPRMHDFRHTFAVHCLEKWTQNGTPLTSVLPRLSAYLGHNNLGATEHYLRMTAEIYPEISEILSDKYGYVVPKFGDSR